jgi:hypothetical protein
VRKKKNIRTRTGTFVLTWIDGLEAAHTADVDELPAASCLQVEELRIAALFFQCGELGTQVLQGRDGAVIVPVALSRVTHQATRMQSTRVVYK